MQHDEIGSVDKEDLLRPDRSRDRLQSGGRRWFGGGECRTDSQSGGCHRVSSRVGLEYVVETGGNRQPCDPFTMLLFKLVLEVVNGVADKMHRRGPAS